MKVCVSRVTFSDFEGENDKNDLVKMLLQWIAYGFNIALLETLQNTAKIANYYHGRKIWYGNYGLFALA